MLSNDEVVGKCDKCGLDVLKSNDVGTILSFFGFNMSIPRHFLSEGECEGSPSRAQYIENQPFDTREGCIYDEKHEAKYRKAYKALQGGS